MADLRAIAKAATPGPWQGCAHVAGTDAECPCRYRGDVSNGELVLLQLGVGPDHPALAALAVIEAAQRVVWEYMHPASGDGNFVIKVRDLRAALDRWEALA